MNKIHITKDGSSTLFSDHFRQFYHNPNGAASESLHVFFEKPGVIDFLKSAGSLTILEVGFGTGLNFLLLLDVCLQYNFKIPVHFYSVEAFPVDKKTAMDFDFRSHLQNPELNDELPLFFEDLKSGMNQLSSKKYPAAELHLFYGFFDEFKTPDLKADFIFHDPFSPEVNEELWTSEVFSKLAKFSKDSVILSTYCAASKARGAMAAAGWKVVRAEGALGKREMTLAALQEDRLQGLKRINEEKLAERYRSGDFN